MAQRISPILKGMTLVFILMASSANIASAGQVGDDIAPGPIDELHCDAVSSQGEFSFVTYNTAGLPPFINGLNDTRHYAIGQLLNDFDIALVQEDFFYHQRLTANILHPYRSPITDFHNIFLLLQRGKFIHDGLHRFSDSPFGEVEHIGWGDCFGFLSNASDCLATKGFTIATHEIAPGVLIDIYNLHHEAGGSEKDHIVRVKGMTLLLERIEISRLHNRAVIVAGDWNLRRSDPMDIGLLDRLEIEADLRDVADVMGEESFYLGRIDRIYYRDSSNLKLQPVSYSIDVEKFSDKDGNALSDHDPISTVFRWQLIHHHSINSN